MKKFDNMNVRLMLLMFLVGTNSALLEPIVSLYLYKNLTFSAIEMSTFYVCLYAGAILFSLLIPFLGDVWIGRKQLLIFSTSLGLLGYSSLLVTRDPWTLIFCCAFFLAPAASNTSQIFAYIRQLDGDSSRVIMFRGIFSAAWVAGPAIGAIVASRYGFPFLFSVLAMSGAIVVLFVLNIPKVSLPAKKKLNSSIFEVSISRVGLIFFAFAILQGTNSLALIHTSIIVTDRLNLDLSYSGYIFAFCAAVEVVYFFVLSKAISKIGETKLIIVGAIFALIYYVSLTYSYSYVLLVMLQLVNAAFIAIITGVGMAWVQSMMPNWPGLATGLFLNSFRIGTLLLLPISSAYSSYFGKTFSDGIVVAIYATIVALVIFVYIHKTEKLHPSGVTTRVSDGQ